MSDNDGNIRSDANFLELLFTAAYIALNQYNILVRTRVLAQIVSDS